MSEPLRPNPPLPKPGVLSAVLLGIGMLILVPSGLCTGLFGVAFLAQTITDLFHGKWFDEDAVDFIFTVAMVGGIPMAIGGLLVFLGQRMRRDK